MAKGKELTLVAARNPQLKKRAKRDWSKAKAARFLSVLEATCNVSEACRQSGVPMTVVYRRKKMDAGFRAAWVEALSVAYSRLELLLLDRAFNGTEKVITRKDGSEDWSIGAEISATVDGNTALAAFHCEALRPPSPVNLLAEIGDNGELKLGWTRRSRLGFAWLDAVDVPLAEARERYRVTLTGTEGAIELESEHPELIADAPALGPVGLGAVTIEVVQIGDFLASQPTSLSINIA